MPGKSLILNAILLLTLMPLYGTIKLTWEVYAMQISQEELRRRLDSSKNLISTVLPIPSITAEKGPDAVSRESEQVPSKTSRPAIATRIVAGSLALQGESVKDIASELGISPAQVRSASKSYDPKIRGPITNSLERVSDLAIDKLMTVLGLMTVDKFIDTNVKDMSIIAANMSRIIGNTKETQTDNRVQLIIYAPESRDQKTYRVVDV